ncbi:MAG: DUF1573 domain-containing protein [Flavobacteriia bacterium]|nr:DUF1573 domain-containing protein [Flavobacteriia bacterium]
MKKMLMTLAVAAFGLMSVNAVAQEENPNAPVLEFEQNVIDYGTIDQDSDGNRFFKFTNTGEEPLIISNVRGSCGCTVPDRSVVNKPFAPGQSGELRVKYDTHRLGRFQKRVTVTSNASQGTINLTIKGVVQQAQTTPVNENQESSRVSR